MHCRVYLQYVVSDGSVYENHVSALPQVMHCRVYLQYVFSDGSVYENHVSKSYHNLCFVGFICSMHSLMVLYMRTMYQSLTTSYALYGLSAVCIL